MGVEAEDAPPFPVLRPFLHDPYGEVAEFHRAREIPLLVRGTHFLCDPLRNRPRVDHHLGALADSGIEGTDQRFPGTGGGDLFVPELAMFLGRSPVCGRVDGSF